jgi:hypothetical protein
VAKEWDRKHADNAGDREGEPAQRGKVRLLTQHILNEQRHDRLHPLSGELRWRHFAGAEKRSGTNRQVPENATNEIAPATKMARDGCRKDRRPRRR